jgi:hypothetical protein
MRMEDWNLRQGSLDDEVTLVTLGDGQNKQQALALGAGDVHAAALPVRTASSLSHRTLLHARSLQLLFTFVRLLLLCTRSHCLFSKPRVALRFSFLLSHRSVPTNGRCCRVIQDLTVAFSTARPTSSPSLFLVDNSCYGRLRLGRQLVIELAQVAHSPS